MSRYLKKLGDFTTNPEYDSAIYPPLLYDEKPTSDNSTWQQQRQHQQQPQQQQPQQQRFNKLTKPRTISTSNSSKSKKCLPPFSITTSRLSTMLSCSKAKSSVDDADDASRRSSTDVSQLSKIGSKSNRHSLASSSGVPDLSVPLQRRATLRAAPPATKSRLPAKDHTPMPILKITDLMEPRNSPLDALDALDLAAVKGRWNCSTPPGYPVWEGFKKGSLRITNGQASPASSSNSSIPLRESDDYFIGAGGGLSARGAKMLPGSHLSPNGRSSFIIPDDQTQENFPGRPYVFQDTPAAEQQEDLSSQKPQTRRLQNNCHSSIVPPGLEFCNTFKAKPRTSDRSLRRTSCLITRLDGIIRLQEEYGITCTNSVPEECPYVNDSGYSSTGSSPDAEYPTLSDDTGSCFSAACETYSELSSLASSPTPETARIRRRASHEDLTEIYSDTASNYSIDTIGHRALSKKLSTITSELGGFWRGGKREDYVDIVGADGPALYDDEDGSERWMGRGMSPFEPPEGGIFGSTHQREVYAKSLCCQSPVSAQITGQAYYQRFMRAM